MAIKYVCKRCGHVLYEFTKIGSSIGLLTPLEVAKLHGYVCPSCKSPLEVPTPGTNYKAYIQIHVKLYESRTPSVVLKAPATTMLTAKA